MDSAVIQRMVMETTHYTPEYNNLAENSLNHEFRLALIVLIWLGYLKSNSSTFCIDSHQIISYNLFKLFNFRVTFRLSLPPVKIHCSVLAEDAIKSAIEDYKAKRAARLALDGAADAAAVTAPASL